MATSRAGVHYPRSTGEVQAWFRTDADCLDYLEWLRWPAGFSCPDCGQGGGWRLGDGRLMCSGCGGRTSVDDAYRKSPVSLIEVPHPVALMRLADCVGFEGVEQVGYRDGFSAVGTGAAEADAGAGLVAVVAPLLAVVAGVAG